MALVALPGGGAAVGLSSAEAVEDFEQEIVDEYALSMAAAGLNDDYIRSTRSVVIEFTRNVDRPVVGSDMCGR